MKTEYDDNGNPFDHSEYKHHGVVKDDVVSHKWNSGKGVVKTSLGDGNTVEHEYHSDVPTSTPTKEQIKVRFIGTRKIL